jgi:hypothetical protein
MANLEIPSKAPANKQIMLMSQARASASFDTAELSSLIWGRYDKHTSIADRIFPKSNLQRWSPQASSSV